MQTINLKKVGNSVMLAVPPAALEELHLQAGAAVDVAVEDGRLVVEPRRQKRYSLEDLLAQCDASAPLTAEDGDWTASIHAGKELL